MTALGCASKRSRYFTAPKRLSNEFGGTIGAEPATRLSLAVAGVSVSDGFNGGRPAACLGSGFAAVVLGADASGRAGSLRFASIAFGFEGGVLAVASAAPPIPTLRAKLAVSYDVSDDDRLVTVWAVWKIKK